MRKVLVLVVCLASFPCIAKEGKEKLKPLHQEISNLIKEVCGARYAGSKECVWHVANHIAAIACDIHNVPIKSEACSFYASETEAWLGSLIYCYSKDTTVEHNDLCDSALGNYPPKPPTMEKH